MTSHQKDNLFKPWIINLELTNACNLECVFCDHLVLKKKMRVSSISEATLVKVLSELKNQRFHELGLVGLGEPTLDPQFEKHISIIDRYSGNFQRISFNSNLVSLSSRHADILAGSQINAYTLSVNASNRRMYLRLMGKDRFFSVLKNLDNLVSALKKARNKARIDVQMIDAKGNDLQELIASVAQPSRVNFFVRKVYTKPVLKKADSPVNVFIPGIKKRYPCWDIYSRVYVDIEGNLYACTIGNDCYRIGSELCFGNVNTGSLIGLFNNHRLSKARKCFESGEIPFQECKKCNVWALTPNNFIWDPVLAVWKNKRNPLRAYKLKG